MTTKEKSGRPEVQIMDPDGLWVALLRAIGTISYYEKKVNEASLKNMDIKDRIKETKRLKRDLHPSLKSFIIEFDRLVEKYTYDEPMKELRNARIYNELHAELSTIYKSFKNNKISKEEYELNIYGLTDFELIENLSIFQIESLILTKENIKSYGGPSKAATRVIGNLSTVLGSSKTIERRKYGNTRENIWMPEFCMDMLDVAHAFKQMLMFCDVESSKVDLIYNLIKEDRDNRSSL